MREGRDGASARKEANDECTNVFQSTYRVSLKKKPPAIIDPKVTRSNITSLISGLSVELHFFRFRR